MASVLLSCVSCLKSWVITGSLLGVDLGSYIGVCIDAVNFILIW